MIAWKLMRWRPAGVHPLELWEHPYRGGLLYERLGAAALEEAAARHTLPANLDSSLAEALVFAVESTSRGAAVEVVGGLVLREGLRRDAQALARTPLRFAEEPLFHVDAGAQAAFAELGAPGGLAVDVGQAALKLVRLGTPMRRRLLERDLAQLPRYSAERVPPPAHSAAEQAARLAAWIASAIAGSLTLDAAPARVLLLALPCPLDAAAVPGRSTYAGWEGDSTWVARMLERVGPLLPPGHPWLGEGVAVLLCSAVELAGASARARGLSASPTLVVSVGAMPSAVWVEARP